VPLPPGRVPHLERVPCAATARVARRTLHAAAVLGHGQFGRYGWGELLATQWLPNSRPLEDVLVADPEAGRKLDLAPLWSTVGRLHDAGLRHGTLLARNVLIRGEPDALEFFLLDLPRFHRFPYGIRGTRMARFDLLFLANTLLRALPPDDLPRWLAAYGMNDGEQAEFRASLRRFRNSSRLRRAVGLEFNVRALLARVGHALRAAGPAR
jgi:hypothetical protein